MSCASGGKCLSIRRGGVHELEVHRNGRYQGMKPIYPALNVYMHDTELGCFVPELSPYVSLWKIGPQLGELCPCTPKTDLGHNGFPNPDPKNANPLNP